MVMPVPEASVNENRGAIDYYVRPARNTFDVARKLAAETNKSGTNSPFRFGRHAPRIALTDRTVKQTVISFGTRFKLSSDFSRRKIFDQFLHRGLWCSADLIQDKPHCVGNANRAIAEILVKLVEPFLKLTDRRTDHELLPMVFIRLRGPRSPLARNLSVLDPSPMSFGSQLRGRSLSLASAVVSKKFIPTA